MSSKAMEYVAVVAALVLGAAVFLFVFPIGRDDATPTEEQGEPSFDMEPAIPRSGEAGGSEPAPSPSDQTGGASAQSQPSDQTGGALGAPLSAVRPPQALPRVLPRSLPGPLPQEINTVDEILQRMAVAQVAFNAPQSVNVNDTAMIQLLLGVTQEIDELKERIEAEGERVGAEVRVSNQMEARLTGPNFSITAITPEVQAISGTEVTEWKWEVQPQEVGSHSLHLTLSAIVSLEDASARRSIRTFDRVIDVEVTWPQRVTGFFGNNWQWLWAAILVPAVTWLWRRRKRAEKTS
ncbi:hypothetical protein F6455_01270 [Proteobacteria bacterium 005FR1]|nr:hypothetical protein [Proteobacteria bacterium 005FR1]